MKKGKVVVTGGAGLIMSATIERLADQAEEIVLLGRRELHDIPEDFRAFIERKKNIKYVRGDVRDRVLIETLIKDAEIVYHWAAMMGTSSCFKEREIPTVEVNIIGTINVLQTSLEAGVKYFVYPPRPALTVWQTPYIISKTAQTHFVQMYHTIHGLPTVGLNIQNCFGPRETAEFNPNPLRPHEGRKFIASNIISALKNESVIVFGDGEQASDFFYVDDCVEACLKAPRDSAIGQICDIGSGISTPVITVAKMIIELTRSKSKIEHLPLRTGEVKVQTKADLTNAKKYLDWEPKVSLEEGLKKTIPYYAKILGIKSPV